MVLRVSRRYSLALYDAAVKSDSLESVIADADMILGLLNSSRQLELFFKSPIISPVRKKKSVTELFGNKIEKLSLEFIFLLIKHKRENIIRILLEDFIFLTKEKKGIVDINIRTAVEMNDYEKEKIIREMEIFTKKKIIANFVIDKNVIGGFTVQVKDTIVDASIKRQLDNLKTKFKEANIFAKN
jgi:F-type H+-transporting ATPase subunit delta